MTRTLLALGLGRMNAPPPAVLAAFAPPMAGWRPVGGGFSGALVFAGCDAAGSPLVALKGYPPATSIARVRDIHRHMTAAGRVSLLVPRLFPTTRGDTFHQAAGRVWELAAWMPGEPLTADPTPARLRSAGAALAELHRAWRPAVPVFAPFPAVERRLNVLRDWRTVPTPRPADPELAELVRGAAARLPALADEAERRLAPLIGRAVAVQPVLGDVHAAHVLFQGDAASGVIDYGAMRPDHPAADLARLLVDLPDADPAPLVAGYNSPDVTADLVCLLADTGRAGSVAGWLLRLHADPTAGGRPAAVADRLRRLLGRRKPPLPPSQPPAADGTIVRRDTTAP